MNDFNIVMKRIIEFFNIEVLIILTVLMTAWVGYNLYLIQSQQSVFEQLRNDFSDIETILDSHENRTIQMAKYLNKIRYLDNYFISEENLTKAKKLDIYLDHIAPLDFEISEIKRIYFKEEYEKFSFNEFLNDIETDQNLQKEGIYQEIFLRFISYKENMFKTHESSSLEVKIINDELESLYKYTYICSLILAALIIILNLLLSYRYAKYK